MQKVKVKLANQGQPDPITNRRMSDGCWNNQHFDSKGEKRCSGWLDEGAPPAQCECLCHESQSRPRAKRDPNASESIMEKHGAETMPGKQCKFSKKNIQCKAIAAVGSDCCLLHGFLYKPAQSEA